MLLIPALTMFAIFSVYPILTGVYLSVTNYDIASPVAEVFVGFNNYVKALTDYGEGYGFYDAFLWTFIFSLAVCAISYIVGFALALVLNQNFKFRGVFRGLLLLPWVIPPAVYSTNWRWILNSEFGFINKFLLNNGWIQQPILFLSTSTLAQQSVIGIGVWRSYPFMMLMILAGLQSISDELYEAASIDGANKLKSFIHITLPAMKNVSIICTCIMFVWTFNTYEHIFLLTAGGPLTSTTPLSIFIYNAAFFRGRMGYAAAIAVLTLIVLLIVSFFYLRFQRRLDD